MHWKNCTSPVKKTFTYSEKSEEKRIEFTKKLHRIPKNKRVYLDESGVHSWFGREYARSLRGTLVSDVKRGKKFHRTNVIGALLGKNHIAVECYNHATDSHYFEDWFEHSLLPAVPRGCTAILDNASFHRKKQLRKLARGKIRLLFLPPYSPDFNRIEKSWANMKRFLHNNISHFISIQSAIFHFFAFEDS